MVSITQAERVVKCKAKTAKKDGRARGNRRGGDKRRDSPAYWERRLEAMGLGMGAGHREWLDYGHEVGDMDFDGIQTFKKPSGESLELGEWPVSLC